MADYLGATFSDRKRREARWVRNHVLPWLRGLGARGVQTYADLVFDQEVRAARALGAFMVRWFGEAAAKEQARIRRQAERAFARERARRGFLNQRLPEWARPLVEPDSSLRTKGERERAMAQAFNALWREP